MVELDMEHVLIFAIVAFMLYHLSRYNCLNNGFSVGVMELAMEGEKCIKEGDCDDIDDCKNCGTYITTNDKGISVNAPLVCRYPREDISMMCGGTCYGTCVKPGEYPPKPQPWQKCQGLDLKRRLEGKCF